MSSIKLRKSLLKELDLLFGEQGFNRRSDRFYGDRYDRLVEGGRKSITPNSHFRKPALVLDPPTVSIRLDKVEEEVFRFEEKSELISEHDALQRNTIGFRLAGNEILNVATNRYAITTEEDCQVVARKYVTEMLRKAERFWAEVPTEQAILERLSNVPGKAREYAGTDLFAAERAIALAKLLYGKEAAHDLASRIMNELSGTPKSELSPWVTRAFQAWDTAQDSLTNHVSP